MAIILTMAAFVWNTKNPGTYRNGFNSFVVGLLWMKVVSFLKVCGPVIACFLLRAFSFSPIETFRSFLLGCEQRYVNVYSGTA